MNMIISRKSSATSRQLGSACSPSILTPNGIASSAYDVARLQPIPSRKATSLPQEALVRSALIAAVGLTFTLCIWYAICQSPIPTSLDVVHPTLTMVGKSVPLSGTVVSERKTRRLLSDDTSEARDADKLLTVSFGGPNVRYLKPGQMICLRLAEFGTGAVSGILQKVDGGKNFAISQVRLIDHSSTRIEDGEECSASVLITGYTAQLTIPESAVAMVDGVPTVLVVRNGRLESRTLVVGQAESDLVPVHAGVHPSDIVVVESAGANVGDAVIPHVVASPA